MFAIVALLLAILNLSLGYNAQNSCYDVNGKAQRCITPFENVALNRMMTATNTCGEKLLKINPYAAVEYCTYTAISQMNKSCDYCRPFEHSSHALTDIQTKDQITWWQSDTMYERILYPFGVNLTLSLPKAFDITHIRLLFQSPRPESFAIYKRTNKNSSWTPYQFYSATCRDTYGLPDQRINIIRGEDITAYCTSEFSDILPLQGGYVMFSTLGHSSAQEFELSSKLQEWITATDIRIVLDQLNTFETKIPISDEISKSYFYAISDIFIGGYCKCNGHASECVKTSDGGRYCICKHNTAGTECEQCLEFYKDSPWGRATEKNANECKKCNCNGFSDQCYFDSDLFETTGHGGHCINCRENREGAQCEKCKPKFYLNAQSGKCERCSCGYSQFPRIECNHLNQCTCKCSY